tara:strand:+ start:2969 stop:3658 length:690 start_codon:yes stop_codon:yes gene_type:complete
MSPIIISFDGNIGSGKSSVVNYFEKNFEKYCNVKTSNYKICFLQEPVKIWESIKDDNGKNAIEKFYENNERYSFAFQMMAYISRLSILKDALSKDYDIIITERSIYTDKNVFAKMLYDSNKMDSIEYQIYLKWFDEFAEIIKYIKIIYIRTNPEICDLRVKKRNRAGEIIPLEYLINCHNYHDNWLNDPEKIESGKTLIIDGNEEINTDKFTDNNYYDELMDKVFNFIK